MAQLTTAVVITRAMEAECFAETDLERIAKVTDLRRAACDDLDDAAQQAAMAGADIIITGWGTQPITPAMLEAAPNLKLMAHSAGSIWYLTSDAFLERGIRVTTARDALARGVAEFALGMMLTAMKAAWQFHAATLEGTYDREALLDWVREPYGATVGIVGASHTGRHMIRLLHAFRLKEILLYDPHVTPEEAAALGTVKVELDDLMRRSDVVALHTPATPHTRHIINMRNLALMKDRAIFINTSRGSCVDENALIAELEAGRIVACMDVTDPEPPEPGSPLFRLPNCIFTPHIAGAVKENKYMQGHLIADEIEAFVEGKPLQYEIDLSQRDRFA